MAQADRVHIEVKVTVKSGDNSTCVYTEDFDAATLQATNHLILLSAVTDEIRAFQHKTEHATRLAGLEKKDPPR